MLPRRNVPIRRGATLVIALLLLIQFPLVASGAEDGPDIPEDTVMNEVSSIAIDGDAQMAAAAAANGWSGNGSEQNPYVIENMNINGSGYAYCLAFHDLRSSHVVIRNNHLYNTSRVGGPGWKTAGVGANNCVHLRVENNTITNTSYVAIGIHCDEGEIWNNVIRNSDEAIFSSTNVGTLDVRFNSISDVLNGATLQTTSLVCENNTVSGRGLKSGVGMIAAATENLSFANNTISDFYVGISQTSGSSVCTGNTIRDCSVGISNSVVTMTIEGNSIFNSSTGIELWYRDVILRNNTLVNSYFELGETSLDYLSSFTIDSTNTVDGKPVQFLLNASNIDIDPSSYGETILVNCSDIKLNSLTYNNCYWIQSAFCDRILITGNSMKMPRQAKWLFYHCDDLQIDHNSLESIDIRHRGDLFNVSNNSIRDGGTDFYISAHGHIDNNTFTSDLPIPITIDHSNYVTIADNNITISKPGIGLYAINMTNRCDRLIMRNNSLWGAGISNPWGSDWGFQGSYYIDQSNTVNGRPILFSEDAISLRISDRYGQIIIYSADRVLIKEATMGPGDGGIGMLYTDNIVIDNCTFEGLMNGAIDAKYCDDVTVSNCIFTGGNSQISLAAVNYYGMSTPGNITRCYFTNLTTKPPQAGAIYLLSSRIVGLTKCYFADIDGRGIYSPVYDRAGIKELTHNEFRNCSMVAIEGTIRTTNVHHNAFVDNGVDTENSQCNLNTGVILDDGSEGNYWSNYRERYPYALRNGTFWDTPYDVGREADHFPYIDYHDFVPPMIRMYCNGSTDPGVTERFSSFSIDNQGVDRIQWWFLVHDERTILSGPEVEFAFNSSGDHTVLLRVFDAAGNVAELSRVVRVTDYVSPRADAGPDLDVPPGATVTFNGSASWDDNTIASYEWTFVYGTFPFVLKGEFANFTFDVEGVYNVTLNVTDPAGHWDVDEMTVLVRDVSPPTAFIGEDVTLAQGTGLHLSGRGSTDNWRIDKYSWTITSPSGNVSRYSTTEVDHVFEEAGTHVVTLRVTDPKGLFDLASINVTALDVTPPVARVRDDVTIDQFETLVLDGTSSTDNEAVVNWTWSITGVGDDLVLYGPVTECSFGSVGYYDVLLTVTDAYGNNASASFTVTVSDAEPPTVVIGEDKEIETGDTVDLDGSGSTDNVGISKYTWTFVYNGIDVEKSGPSISYRFDQEGKYTITLTVEDMAGNSASDSLVVTVVTPFRDTEPPQALAGDDVTIDQHAKVALDASSSIDNVGITSFSWHIAGGDVDTTLDGTSTEFTFDAVGEYTVTLTVSDAAGNTATDDLTVTVLDADPPVAEAGPNIQVKREETITLDGSASSDNVGVVSWVWTIVGQGLELTREGETVTLTLIALGDYNVTLEVSDARGNTARDTLVLTVVPPPVNGHDEPDEEGISMVLVGGIAAAVIVAVLVVVLLVLRRKPGE